MRVRISNSVRPAWGVALLMIGASALFLLSQSAHFSFVSDEWDLLLRRPGWGPDDFLAPFHEHVIVAPAFIYKTLEAIFGLGSYRPYYLTAVVVFAAAGVMLFSFLRSRVGAWLALCGVLPVAFLGGASEDLLWAFQIGFFGSVAAGLGVLLALGRENRRADLAACGLLVVSLAFSSIGIAFLAAAVVDVVAGRRPRRDRIFLVAVPFLVYLAWYVGWGHQSRHHVSLENLVHLPSFVLNAAGASVATLSGQAPAASTDPERAGVAYDAAALALGLGVSFRIWRDRRCSRGLAVALALLFAFWILAGLDRDPNRSPVAQRYQYPAVVFLLVVAAEALDGIRLRVSAKVVAAILAIFAAVSGARLLEHERALWNNLGWSTRSVLGGVEVAGPAARQSHVITEQNVRTSVARYRTAVDKYGSPAFDEAEILAHGPVLAGVADLSLIRTEGLHLVTATASHVGCRLIGGDRTRATTTLHPGEWVIENRGGGPVDLLLGRFSSPNVALTPLREGQTRSLLLPVDASRRLWRLAVQGESALLCRGAPGARSQARPAAIATRSSPVAKR